MLEYWVEFSAAVLYSLTCEENALRPTYVSKNFSRLTGHERTAMIVDPEFWIGVIHPDDRESFDQAVEQLMNGETSTATIEYRAKQESGNFCDVIDSMRVNCNREGQPLEIISAWLDLTTRN